MDNYINIINFAGIIVEAMIIIVYGLATYWNIRFLIHGKKAYDWVLMLYASIATLVITCLYVYLLIEALKGNFDKVTLFGIMVTRPAILFLGGAVASMARARYISLKHGGLQWILPKYKE